MTGSADAELRRLEELVVDARLEVRADSSGRTRVLRELVEQLEGLVIKADLIL